ncbi:MAG: primase [Rickettsiales bacterium]|jgi:DNA primase|nr:primase [Rickettsiales bacterium]
MLKYPPQFIEELRTRIRPSEFIGKTIRLRPKGGGEFLGLCPFHGEKTPSFTVSDPKAFYHCFGCGEHGDIVKFVMETQGLRYPEAIKYLADQYGIPIPEAILREERRPKTGPDLYQVTELACKWFEEQLRNNRGQEAQEYLKRRELKPAIIDYFRLGYSPPDRHGLKTALMKQGVPEKMLVEAGLLIQNEQGETYDRFRGRVIFPIMDTSGRVIAFGGRILGDGQPKYLNSPETPIFHKGDVLYSGKEARKAAYKEGKVVVSEGYMDVIALHRAGIQYAVAPLGTALTEAHLHQLWRMVSEPILCMDGDTAGQRAMARITELALPHLAPGASLAFAVLPQGMDPDDVLKSQGAEALKEHLKHAVPLSEVIWNIELSREPVATPEQKASLEKRLEQRAQSIKNEPLKHHYRRFFKEKFWEWSRNNTKSLQNGKKTNAGFAAPSADLKAMSAGELSPLEGYHRILFMMILHYPMLLADEAVMDEFMHLEVAKAELENLRSAILDWHANVAEEEIDGEGLRQAIEKQGFRTYIESMKADPRVALSVAIPDTDSSEMVREAWARTLMLHNLALMEGELHQAVERAAQDMTESRYAQVSSLKEQIAEYKKMLDIH